MAFSERPKPTGDRFEIETYYEFAFGSDKEKRFGNLDDAAGFEGLLRSVQSCDTDNFVLDFSDSAACVSFDISTATIDALLSAERPTCLNTRWINIWHPSSHNSFIELLAKRYDFSPRLFALMISDNEPRQTRNNVAVFEDYGRSYWRHRHDPSGEAGKGLDDLSQVSTTSSQGSVARGNLHTIINDMWHYSSIDFGRSYICLGYNSLYTIKGHNVVDERLPQCLRSWTWLVLCDDHTVISINEDPFPFSQGRLDSSQQHVVASLRRNLVNVFRSLSKVEEESLMERKPLGMFPIRARLGNTLEETTQWSSDMHSLLFYYLFENWHNSYTLINRRESAYGLQLKKLRAEMFQQPKLGHIDRLDTIGTELGVLKNHFESYNRLMQRLLEPQTITAASLQNYSVALRSSQASFDTVRPVALEKANTLGVGLSSATRVRFERLKDLIDLFALAEIDEFIKQKDSLVAMNLQLIAIKESFDVEKLTRITLLLTKITMVFLPVSLMTAYFSVPLEAVSYTLKDFWISFGTVVIVSWSAMFIFGLFSGTVQTLPFRNGVRRVGRGVERYVRGPV